MKHGVLYIVGFTWAVCASVALSMPAHAASKSAELRAACKGNPTHAVCVDLQAKADKAKARKEAKLQGLIDQVKGN